SRRARWKRQGLPSSRRNPCDHSPYSSDPGVTRQAEWTMSKLPGAAPATHHARLASGCWSSSTGRDWLPAGFHLKGFKLPTILLSRASWREVRAIFRFSGRTEARGRLVIRARKDEPTTNYAKR